MATPSNENDRAMEALTIDFRDPTYRTDPYPQLALLRQYDPVHQTSLGFWLITRYESVSKKYSVGSVG